MKPVELSGPLDLRDTHLQNPAYIVAVAQGITPYSLRQTYEAGPDRESVRGAMLNDSAFTGQRFARCKTTRAKGLGGVGSLVAGLRESAFGLQFNVDHLLNNSTAPPFPVWQRRFEDLSIKPLKILPVIPHWL
jgi:hypothetical protein